MSCDDLQTKIKKEVDYELLSSYIVSIFKYSLNNKTHYIIIHFFYYMFSF